MADERGCRAAGPHTLKGRQVLDAARRLFIENGFGATSMDAIAARAGVSKATLYAYYPGKQALFAATARRECHRVTAQMALGENLTELPLAAALEKIARAFVRPVFSNDVIALLRMAISEVGRFPEIGRIYYECGPGLMHHRVADYMRQARDCGLIAADDCELAAAQFLSMLRGDRHLRRLLGYAVADERLEATIVAAIQTFMARYAL